MRFCSTRLGKIATADALAVFAAALMITSLEVVAENTATLVATGYTGTTSLANFQALVKLAEGDDYGFTYAGTEPEGADIWFADSEGNVIPHEIDTWDASGESFVWVCVPSLSGQNTEITMHWGDIAAKRQSTENAWSGFVGVWHMRETGTAEEGDSTASGLDASPRTYQDAAASIDAAAGIVGAGRANVNSAYFSVGSESTPYSSYITDKAKFSVGGWCRLTSVASGNAYQRIFCGMSGSSLHSWDVWRESASAIGVRSGNGSANTSSTGYSVPIAVGGAWHYLVVVWDGTAATVYDNGAFVATQTLRANTHPNVFFTIGGRSKTSSRSFAGCFDEVRMFNGLMTADRVAADYATMSSPTTFLTLRSDTAVVRAEWTGGAGDGDVSKPGNWNCYNSSNAKVDGAIPTSLTSVTVSSENLNFQAPSGTSLEYASITFGSCTLAADCNVTGLGDVVLAADAGIELAGHSLELQGLTGSGTVDSAGAAGGEVVFDVAEGASGVWRGVSIADGVKIVKKGGGILNEDATRISAAALDGVVSTYEMRAGNMASGADLEIGAYGTGEFVQSGGSVALSGWLNIGRWGGDGTLTVEGGTFRSSYNGAVLNRRTYVGAHGGVGTINVGGDANVVIEGQHLDLGSKLENTTGTGRLNISGSGKLTVSKMSISGYSDVYVGSDDALCHGEILQSGGEFSVAGNFQLGKYGTGTFTQTGGKAQCYGYFSIGRYGTGVGTFAMTGGTYISSACEIIVGEAGVGTMTVSGDAVAEAPKGIVVGHSSGGTGTLIVTNGGTLATSSICSSGEDATKAHVTFDGATVRVTAGGYLLKDLEDVTIGSGALALDIGAYTVSITNTTLKAEPDLKAITVEGTGTLDFSTAAIEFTSMPHQSYTFAVASDGVMVGAPELRVAGGSRIGTFEAVLLDEGRILRIRRPGTLIIVK